MVGLTSGWKSKIDLEENVPLVIFHELIYIFKKNNIKTSLEKNPGWAPWSMYRTSFLGVCDVGFQQRTFIAEGLINKIPETW